MDKEGKNVFERIGLSKDSVVVKKVKDAYTKRKGLVIALCALVVFLLGFCIFMLSAKVQINEQKTYAYVYPKTQRSYLVKELKKQDIKFNNFVFKVFSKVLISSNVKTGRYEVKKGMSVFALVRKIAGGRQTAVSLVIGKSRTKAEFAQKVGEEFLFGGKELLVKLNDKFFLNKYGVDSITALNLFIPNTYNIYWNTSIEKFFSKMKKENTRFWLDRQSKLNACGLDKNQVLTIASIVEEETNYAPEKAKIAGVYINRFQKGMLLQADPTVKYAIGDFTIKRITLAMTTFPSPYNTYKTKGLPPSPICIPSVESIDAVLGYEHHNFLYFCAKEDFSGRHNFATTPQEHMHNAQLYQQALNAHGIQ